jgi:hypothetical protein
LPDRRHVAAGQDQFEEAHHPSKRRAALRQQGRRKAPGARLFVVLYQATNLSDGFFVDLFSVFGLVGLT